MSARGGAGNILAASQQKAHTFTDLEANAPLSEHVTTVPFDTNREYAHSGRGGAGNYYSPKDLSQKGDFDVSERKEKDESVAVPGSAPVKVGRGGAGNFTFGKSGDSEEEKKRKEEEEKGKVVNIEREVEEGVGKLQMPEKAKLAGGERDLVNSAE